MLHQLSSSVTNKNTATATNDNDTITAIDNDNKYKGNKINVDDEADN